jgi:MSHA biogenesis protein MshJ
VALAVVFGPLLIGYSLFVDPQSTRLKAMETTLATEGATVTRLQAEAANLQQFVDRPGCRSQSRPWPPCMASATGWMNNCGSSSLVLVRPEEMNGLLERLLARHAGLRLVSLKTLAPQSVLPVGEVKAGDAKPVERSFDLYRHGWKFASKAATGSCRPTWRNWKSCSKSCCGESWNTG